MEKILNGVDFYHFFKFGASEVSKKREVLNTINVFPVHDGDTGTNLVMTMGSIVDESEPVEDIDSMLKTMSDVAIESARGNSGLIFASFLGGFSTAFKNMKEVNMESFGIGASKAAEEAYQSVSIPVEGTMLTVMREWADYLSANSKNHGSFREFLEGAYQKAKQALEETPDKLEILKKNRVVDAGAKGFVLFLEGVNHFFSGVFEPAKEEPFQINTVSTEEEHFKVDALNYRFCTEFVVKYASVNDEISRESIGRFGDSVVLSSNGNKTKIHLHTNHPEHVADYLIQSGFAITKTKVDDMRIQNEVIVSPRSKIGILTDSIADISGDLLLEEQIHVLSLALIADESVLLDKITATSDNIDKILNMSKTYPSSSQPEVKQVLNKLMWMKQYYDEVIVLSVSKALSGTYNVFEKAISTIADPQFKVHLIDTRLNTAGQGLLVLKAAQMANAGYSSGQILKTVEESISKIDVYVSLDTFEYAVKSGRVPNRIGKILMKLGAKPIMSLKRTGEGTAFGLAFSRKSIDSKIEKVVRKIHKAEGIEKYAIVHAGNEVLAQEYALKFEHLLGMSPSYIVPISAITTIHAGMGSVAIALIKKEAL